ncbi:MAG: DUF362 domain-containing protein [Spirochaetaceae bacterium]|jgi:hypothetical protein|nr:DUF362 domain-containing protein [Spirochaetaceae bacterium]
MKAAFLLFILCGALGCTGGGQRPPAPAGGASVNLASSSLYENAFSGETGESPAFQAPPGNALVLVREGTNGTDNGLALLLDALGRTGKPFFRDNGNDGFIDRNDTVIIKINSQWAERGGTNTDLLKALIQYMVGDPGGFSGEIIIADNGQGMFGSERRGGSLDWDNTNAKDQKQSAGDVADYFAAQGHRVSGFLWDTITRNEVREYSDGDGQDGFVLGDTVQPANIRISYPKFTTRYGTRVSFKMGIWDEDARQYRSRALKIINMPVLKHHSIYQVTGAIKSYMGVPSNSLTSMSPHQSVGRGGMGALMVHTRIPVLNILDMIWISPDHGPSSRYSQAAAKNMTALSTDPAALDYWAAKYVLMDAAKAAGNARYASLSPDAAEPGSFGYWLRLSAEELRKGGFPAIIDEARITVLKIGQTP